jgi:hypothetical protein
MIKHIFNFLVTILMLASPDHIFAADIRYGDIKLQPIQSNGATISPESQPAEYLTAILCKILLERHTHPEEEPQKNLATLALQLCAFIERYYLNNHSPQNILANLKLTINEINGLVTFIDDATKELLLHIDLHTPIKKDSVIESLLRNALGIPSEEEPVIETDILIKIFHKLIGPQARSFLLKD